MKGTKASKRISREDSEYSRVLIETARRDSPKESKNLR